jgi:peptidase M48-like protein/PDZ domain-containing protein
VTRRAVIAVLVCLLLPAPAVWAGPAERPELLAEAERLEESAFQVMLARERKLLEVASRVREASAEICGDRLYPVLGLVIEEQANLYPSLRRAALRLAQVGDEPRVLWVLPTGPAAKAGVQEGDIVRGLAGRSVRHMDFLHRIESPKDQKRIELVVERQGKRMTLDMEHVPGCLREPSVALFDQRNAYFDFYRTEIVVFSGMMRLVKSDDELASVIGHELGHGVYGDHDDGPVAESAADYFGAYATARAGYDVAAGAEFEQRIASDFIDFLIDRAGHSHPNSAQRELATRATLAEIEAKRQRGEPLVPRVIR